MSYLNAKSLAHLEDQRTGRVIPSWRYWLSFLIPYVALFLGGTYVALDWNLWAYFGIGVVISLAHSSLLSRYRQRTLS